MVSSIIALLIAILLPALSGVREQGRRTVCLSNQRQVAIAAYAYSVDNSNKIPVRFDAPTADNFGHVPYLWDVRGIIEPFEDYSMPRELIACPSSDVVTATVRNGDVFTVSSVLDGYNANIIYLGGLGITGAHNSTPATSQWYDGVPGDIETYTAVTDQIEAGVPGERVLTADLNTWNNIGGPWSVITNHGGGIFPGAVSLAAEVIPGSNRVFGDGHGEWAQPSEMGRDFTAIDGTVEGSHYSHFRNFRPYWW